MRHNVVDLTDPDVAIHHWPLVMHAVRSNQCTPLAAIIRLRSADAVLNKVYEYEMPRGTREAERARVRESVLSRLSEDYVRTCKAMMLDAEAHTIHELCHALTRVILQDFRLVGVHPAVFHAGIVHIDLRGNQLTELPLFSVAEDEQQQQVQQVPQCPLLETLTISDNLFTEISEAVFRLPCLRELHASNNRVSSLPLQMWLAPKLETLVLARNQITALPCPNSFSLVVGGGGGGGGGGDHLGHTFLRRAGSSAALLSVRQSHFNSTAGSPQELDDSQRGFGLRLLDLSGNFLTAVPQGLECLAPLLKTLKLGNNRITALGRIQDYPSRLETLILSDNRVEHGFVLGQQQEGGGGGGGRREGPNPRSRWCYQAQLTSLNPVCSHYCHTKLSALKQLNLSNNNLQTLSLCWPLGISGESDPSPPSSPDLLFHKLNSLNLSWNRLVRVPEHIHRLEKLAELNIDGNGGITEIPSNLCYLEWLFSFKFEGVQDPMVTELATCRTVAEMRKLMKLRGVK